MKFECKQTGTIYVNPNQVNYFKILQVKDNLYSLVLQFNDKLGNVTIQNSHSQCTTYATALAKRFK